MFIKNFDYLSPRISIYYQGNLSHSSIVSGILSIISVISIIYLGIYFSFDFIKKNQPNGFYYTSFIKDAGIFYINTSSLFHFVNINNNIKGEIENEKIDFTIYNIIGMQIPLENFFNEENNQIKYSITNNDHWLYGYCDKTLVDENIEDLIFPTHFFDTSACIKKYYSKIEKKYYDVGDEDFKWPRIAYGTFNDNNELYSIFIQKCNNNLLNQILGINSQCKEDSEIENYNNINGQRIFRLYFINNYINILDYHHPTEKYFFKIETYLKKNICHRNEISFRSNLVKTHEGVIFEKTQKDSSYMYNRVDRYSETFGEKYIYVTYTFYLKNTRNYYERTYKKIPDVISDIGGFCQIINIIAGFLNDIYNSFIVIIDTEALLGSLINMERKKHKKDARQYKKLKELSDGKTKTIYDKKKKEHKDKKIKEKLNEKSMVKKNMNVTKSNENIFDKENDKQNITDIQNNQILKNDVENYDNLNELDTIYTIKKNEANFWAFLMFKIFKKKNRYLNFYEHFRTRIISEEHFIRNHLNIYNLLKATEKKRISRKNTYRLSSVIKLL